MRLACGHPGAAPRSSDVKPRVLTILRLHPVARGQDAGHVLPFGFTSKVQCNKLCSQGSLATFPHFLCRRWSGVIYHVSPRRFLGNRCGLEFDKSVTSTRPCSLFGILTLETAGQLNKQPTPSVLVLTEVETPETS